MATVKVTSTRKEMNNQMTVNLEVRTSAGMYVFPFRIGDHGDMGANERAAKAELRTFLQEALGALD